MKTRLMMAAVCAIALSGCTVTKIEAGRSADGTGRWSLARTSVFQKPEIQGVKIAPDGSAELTGYKNGEDVSAIAGAVVGAAISAATKAGAP